MSNNSSKLPSRATKKEVEDFLQKIAATPTTKLSGERGRLIFAMDATASREPTWDEACHIQAQMFEETASLGGLEIQLCYYRGFREFGVSPWLMRSEDLLSHMSRVTCAGGITQIERVLTHAVNESKAKKASALVFVGDCMEEDIDVLSHMAGELGLLGVPVFIFHEGFDTQAERAFREVARLSNGAYCRFDAASAQQLRDLLSAVAVFAAGGRKALENFGQRKGGVALRLTHELRRTR